MPGRCCLIFPPINISLDVGYAFKSNSLLYAVFIHSLLDFNLLVHVLNLISVPKKSVYCSILMPGYYTSSILIVTRNKQYDNMSECTMNRTKVENMQLDPASESSQRPINVHYEETTEYCSWLVCEVSDLSQERAP
jgi:hypothetical protein